MNKTAFKIAASTLIVGMTMVGCSTQSDAMRRLNGAAQGRPDREAATLFESASRAMRAGQLPAALTAMEQAVALSPRDAGYRMLLADIYLKSGRLDAARATYADVVELDPSNNRAGLSLALMHIALGRPQAAVAQLDDLAGRAPAADLGLAFALAGMPERAVEILEPAARNHDATARIRQNLALSYAMAGDWRRARAIAAQDISPADLPERMEQWASFARPGTQAAQVTAMLGVTPVEDAGQPARLALAPAAPAQAFAEAAPSPVFAEAAPAASPVPAPAPVAPVAYAQAEAPPAEAPAFWVPTAQSYQQAPQAEVSVASSDDEAPDAVAPSPSPPAEMAYAAAARSLVAPQPAMIRAAAVAPMPAPVFQRERARPTRPAPARTAGSGTARIVVQLGAFSNEANAERAWLQAERRYGLQGQRPLTTTIAINGRTLHRVSVAGFAAAGEAHRLCGSIRTQGGACFVRGQAGDASIRWAARYAGSRTRNA